MYDDGIGFEANRLVYYAFNRDDESKWETCLLLSRAKQHTLALVAEVRRLRRALAEVSDRDPLAGDG